MGKNKRLKPGPVSTNSSKKQKTHKTLTRPSGISKSTSAHKPPSKPTTTQAIHSKPTIPFSPSDAILLIGEGDLSFARSLIEEHRCENVTATVLESEKELREKYPHVVENVAAVEEGGGSVRYGVDAGKMKPFVDGKGRKGLGVMDRVFFNFPHVGGKSTDVNRQVRYNQELLVSFFKQALPSLSPTKGSSIIVTLFEGEPYTLWNIRDLGRHSGLEVAQSFRFQAKAYPGYKHARTLGVVKGKGGKKGGGWKGEERSARSYVFVRKGEGVVVGNGKGKRAKSVSSDDDDEEEEEDEEPEEGFEDIEDIEGLETGSENEDEDSDHPPADD
ncbi:hypothetical protein LZ554_006288 [Drepanopeziza brunnea f. sp. 'monogermtubi']|nr:hypothetical protein LZ554_006288 [Drepanopeziza brunnea f. sp. 'monogermtubi']